MRSLLVYWLLVALKLATKPFYRQDWRWVGKVPAKRWGDYRLVAILNHTSLYEPLLAGGVPNKFLRRMSEHGVIPVADITTSRPIIGKFFKMLARNVVPISRERDRTWSEVLGTIDPDSMVVILPEGRMKRADGLDKHGRPLTLRGGIVELMDAIGDGKLLLAYSHGLHHIQVPGQPLPKIWKTIHLRLEEIDIASYRQEILERIGQEVRGKGTYRKAMLADLTARRDHYCEPANDGLELTPYEGRESEGAEMAAAE